MPRERSVCYWYSLSMYIYVQDMYDMPYARQMYRPRLNRPRITVMPQDVLTLLDPWAATSRYGGRMCRKKNRKHNGKITKPKPMERLPLKNFAAQTKRCSITEEPWETTVKAEGFKPSDLMILLNGRTVVINGVRSEGDEDSGIIKTEFRRKVTLPNDVILPTLEMDFKDGNIVLSGRRRVMKTKPVKENDPEEVCSEEGKVPEKTSTEEVRIPIIVESRNATDESSTPAAMQEDVQNTDGSPSNATDESSTPAAMQEDVQHTDGSPSECTAAADDQEMDTTPPECKCEDSSKCTNSECPQKSDTDSIVTVEDIGPEEEMDGVPVSPTKVDAPKEKVAEKVAEVRSPSLKVTAEVKAQSISNEVAKKAETSSQVAQHKPVTWSIPIGDFAPKDVSVRLEDDVVRVVAEREEEHEGMTFFRRIERSFAMPKHVDPDTLSSHFCTDDGKLILKAMPLKQLPKEAPKEVKMSPAKTPTKSLQKDQNGWTILPISFE